MYKLILDYLNENDIFYKEDYPTFKISSMEVGGIANIAIFPKSEIELCNVLKCIQVLNLRFFVIGQGTNIFFSDKGFGGVLIFTSFVNKIFVGDEEIIAQCGAKITDCSIIAMLNGLSGLEFACGIPGSVGGAMFMNSSAFENSISDVVISANIFDMNEGCVKIFEKDSLDFKDKSSVFSRQKNIILLNARFTLKKTNAIKVKEKTNFFTKKRILSQPLYWGNCGSAFKRPPNAYASKLIDNAGLKGAKNGGAEVSKKHAGFIINSKNATSKDVCNLLNDIKSTIHKRFSVSLEQEIIYVNEE